MFEKRIGRPLAIVIFSSVILLAGVGCGGAIVFTTLAPYLQARGWHVTKANVMILSLYANRRGRRARTTRCRAVYQYRFAGQQYTGTNVSFVTSDPFGNFQKFLCDILQIAKDANTSECYVDSNHPQNAILTLRFPAELLTLGFAALTVLGGFFLYCLVKAAIRLKTGYSLGYSQVSSGPLWSQERTWPLPFLIAGMYMLTLALFTIWVSIDNITKGIRLSIANLLIGVSQLAMAIYCGFRIRQSQFGGLLMLPNHVQESGGSTDLCGNATLFIPRAWRGKPNLVVNWVVENDILGYTLLFNEVETAVQPLSERDDPTSKFREFEFDPGSLASHVAGTEMVGINVFGDVGGEPYSATFLTGKAFEYQSLATRRELGVSFRLLSEIIMRRSC